MLIGGLINVAKNIIFAKILGPEFLGVYSFLMLLANYSIFLCSFGVYEGSMAVLPGLYGQGRINDAKDIRNRAAGLIIIFSLIITLSMLLSTAVFKFADQSIMVTLGIFAGVTTFLSFILGDIRSRLLTKPFGLIMLVRSIFSLLMGIAASYLFGYMGIIVSEIVIGLILIMVAVRKLINNFKIDVKSIFASKPIFRLGVPLVVNDIITFSLYNVDKFFVLKKFGTLILGQYSFAMLMMTCALLFRGIIYQHLNPLILFKIGAGERAKSLFNKMNLYILGVIICALVIWKPAILLLQTIGSKFFAEYEQAFLLMDIIYWGSVIAIISHYDYFIIAAKRTEYLLIANIVVCIFALSLFWYGLSVDWTIFTYANAFVLIRVLYLLLTFITAFFVVSGSDCLGHSREAGKH